MSFLLFPSPFLCFHFLFRFFPYSLFSLLLYYFPLSSINPRLSFILYSSTRSLFPLLFDIFFLVILSSPPLRWCVLYLFPLKFSFYSFLAFSFPHSFSHSFLPQLTPSFPSSAPFLSSVLPHFLWTFRNPFLTCTLPLFFLCPVFWLLVPFFSPLPLHISSFIPLSLLSFFPLPLPPLLPPYQWEDRKQESDDEAGDQFDRPVSSPPAREAVVPQRGQQLLAVRLSHKLKGESRRETVRKYSFRVLFLK